MENQTAQIRRSLASLLFAFASPLLLAQASAQTQVKDIEIIRERILAYEAKLTAPSAAAIRALYNTPVRNNDLKMMGRAYASPGHELYHDAGLAAAFRGRLVEYCKRDPSADDPNWWVKQVPEPNIVARALLLMGDAITAADYNAAKTIINRAAKMNENPPYRTRP